MMQIFQGGFGTIGKVLQVLQHVWQLKHQCLLVFWYSLNSSHAMMANVLTWKKDITKHQTVEINLMRMIAKCLS